MRAGVTNRGQYLLEDTVLVLLNLVGCHRGIAELIHGILRASHRVIPSLILVERHQPSFPMTRGIMQSLLRGRGVKPTGYRLLRFWSCSDVHQGSTAVRVVGVLHILAAGFG
jgi:hypothetical protein